MRSGPYTGYGPRGYRRADERILEDICDRLTQHAQIDATDIEVEVRDGEVTLTGTVEDRRIKRMVEANVELIPGVVDVHNHLKLRNRPTPEEEARQKAAEEMAEKFPGGPTPTGNAGY
jgi:osmotically-inducible protein OsmY